MTILGIDPGIGRTGWGVIGIQNSEFRIQNCGCIETDSKLETSKRLVEIYNQVSDLIDKYNPNVLAVEELFFNTNSKTAFVVGQARGVILLAGGKKGIETVAYTPLQVKMAVTGYGRSEKAQVGQMIKVILNLKNIPKPDDVCDALAVAITHASFRKMKNFESR